MPVKISGTTLAGYQIFGETTKVYPYQKFVQTSLDFTMSHIKGKI